jgi:hypothetical protein
MYDFAYTKWLHAELSSTAVMLKTCFRKVFGSKFSGDMGYAFWEGIYIDLQSIQVSKGKR